MTREKTGKKIRGSVVFEDEPAAARDLRCSYPLGHNVHAWLADRVVASSDILTAKISTTAGGFHYTTAKSRLPSSVPRSGIPRDAGCFEWWEPGQDAYGLPVRCKLLSRWAETEIGLAPYLETWDSNCWASASARGSPEDRIAPCSSSLSQRSKSRRSRGASASSLPIILFALA
jgi:hypothetical protein